MSKTILAAALGLALRSALPAQLVDVNVHAGYTTFAMGDLNSANNSLWGYNMGYPAYNGYYYYGIDRGVVAGVDLTTSRFLPVQGLVWGLRSEAMQSNLAEFKADNVPPYSIGAQYTDRATLTTVLVGGKYSLPFVTDGLSLGLGAWAGGGYGVLDQHATQDLTGPYSIQNGVFSAMLPVAELESSVDYKLGSHVSVSLSGGWRWADAPQVKNGGEALYNNWQKWYNATKSPVNVDFSGATAQGSVSYSF